MHLRPLRNRTSKKTLVVAANSWVTVDVECNGAMRKYFSMYHVEMRILTGFGMMSVKGELKLRDKLEYEKKKYSCHINWHEWGFHAGNTWCNGRELRTMGHPF